MSTLFDYLDWRGDITFNEMEPNKLDAAILAHMTYAAFDGLVPENFKETKTLSQFASDFNKTPDYQTRVKDKFLKNKKTDDITQQLAVTKRFGDIKLTGYRNIYNAEKAEQFAAITYRYGKYTIVAFRGTDDTFAGWHEDFNMGWMDEVPAETDAVQYIKDLSKRIKGKLILTGHSKGGHLAVAVAAKVPFLIRRKIQKVYNFDGPGFAEKFFKTVQYKRIESRTEWVYPSASLVGMIFYHPDNFEIIKAEGIGAVNQHNIITWNMMGGDFVHANGFDEGSGFFHKAFNEWFENISHEQREKFVKALFDVVEASGVKTLHDFEKSLIVSGVRMITKLNSMEKDSKEEVKKILKILSDAVKKTARNIEKEKNFKKSKF